MNKKSYLTLFFLILFLCFRSVMAQSPTASSSPTLEPTIDKQIEKLKEKIADKVAELKKSDEKAIAGVILEIKDGLISINTIDDQKLDVKYDDALSTIYLISGAVKKEIKLSDLEKDDYIIVTGPMINNTITANYIYQDEEYIVKSGKVTEINKTDYFIKVLSLEKDNYTLDFETYSQTEMLNVKTYEIEKTGFSKIKETDVVHFVLKKASGGREVNRYSIIKILVIPQEYFVK